MARRLISSGSTFEKDIGYSRAVVDGDWIFVSGTTGFDYQSMTISDDVAVQTEQCLRNIQSALEQAGASFRDVVRVTYVLPRRRRLSGVLAHAAQVLWRGAPRRYDDFRRARRSAHADRDRSDGAPRGMMDRLRTTVSREALAWFTLAVACSR